MKLALLLFIIFLASCSSEPVKYESSKTVRVKVLENGTVTYCKLDSFQTNTLHYLDKIWVSLDKHIMDDTDSTAMQCIILK